MAATPQIALRDGSGFATSVVFTTNQEFVTITGTVDVKIIALQVSVNGSPYSSDASLIFLDLTNFTVPNLAVMPDGLPLDVGVNTILIRAVDIVGGVSPPATISITRILQVDQIAPIIPTGIKLQRARNVISLSVFIPTFSNNSPSDNTPDQTTFGTMAFQGFNVYASTSPGGTTGYFKVNASLLTGPVDYQAKEFTLTSASPTFLPQARFLRIQITQEDVFGQEVSRQVDASYDILNLAPNLKVNYEVQPFTLSPFVTFTHDRNGGAGIINSDQFTNVQPTDPLYYVVTGVYYDSALSQEVETPYSQEVLGSPLIIDTNVKDLPGRKQLQIVTDFVSAVQRVNAEITLIPGSTTRDVNIDPFSSEAERIWFLIDFVHRSMSFVTLLQIDDADGDGVSDVVAGSAYKQALRAALGFTTDTAVQQLIDTQFEKLAKNFNKTRLPGRPAVGQVVFYTVTRPSQDIIIATGAIVSSNADASGVAAQRFFVGGTFVLPAANADAFFNFDTKRYEITADITGASIGEAGNRPAGSIVNAQGVNGVSVINTESTVFGTDRESNADLAARAMLGFVSVDTGTEGGYASTSAEQIGVIKAKIIKSGDPLMMRDYDDVRHKHIGGKVDIFIQGLRERTVSETFAFTFDVARDIRVEILDLPNMILRVLDSRVTPDTPIIEILDNLVQGLGVRNVTTGMDYDLTGVTILTYNTFQINTLIPQPPTAIDDIIIADYRFRSVNQFKFTLQPVRRVISVVGEVSGALTLAGYDLFKTEDPLMNGESTIASDHLVINQVGGIPSGANLTVSDEQHVLIGFFEEPLASIGINQATIRVFNQSRSVEYNGPGTLSPDFDIIPGTPTTPIKILRVNHSNITSGATVSVDYDHDENFTVTYVINDILQELQQTVNNKRHITADVLVKQAIENPIAIETTIQLKSGATKDKADPAVRSSVSLELNQKLIGQGTAQSDIINAVDSTDGVDFQVIPLASMGYQDGSRKIREPLSSTFIHMASLDTGGNQAFILTSGLQYPTTDGGGLVTEHKGVFQDDEPLTVVTILANVASASRQAYIIGADGADIAGYSDAATLISEGFTSPEEILAEQLRRTANHVVVSISNAAVPPDDPSKHVYAVSYVIRGDNGPHDITVAAVEFIELGDLTLTFRNST